MKNTYKSNEKTVLDFVMEKCLIMVLPISCLCQPSLHHRYQMLCTRWQTRRLLFFRFLSALALHLERSPPFTLLLPFAHNSNQIVFFFSWVFLNIQFSLRFWQKWSPFFWGKIRLESGSNRKKMQDNQKWKTMGNDCRNPQELSLIDLVIQQS